MIDPLEVVNDFTYAISLNRKLLVKYPKIYTVCSQLFLLRADKIGYIEVVNQLTVNTFKPKQKLIHTFKVLKYSDNLFFIVLHSFKVFLVVVDFSH